MLTCLFSQQFSVPWDSIWSMKLSWVFWIMKILCLVLFLAKYTTLRITKLVFSEVNSSLEFYGKVEYTASPNMQMSSALGECSWVPQRKSCTVFSLRFLGLLPCASLQPLPHHTAFPLAPGHPGPSLSTTVRYDTAWKAQAARLWHCPGDTSATSAICYYPQMS